MMKTWKMVSSVAFSAALLGGSLVTFGTANAATPTTVPAPAPLTQSTVVPQPLTNEDQATSPTKVNPKLTTPTTKSTTKTVQAQALKVEPAPEENNPQLNKPVAQPPVAIKKEEEEAPIQNNTIVGKIKSISGNKLTLYKASDNEWEDPSFLGSTATYTLTSSTSIVVVTHDEDGEIVKQTKQALSSLNAGDIIAVTLSSGTQNITKIEIME